MPSVGWELEDNTLVPSRLGSLPAETLFDTTNFLELQQINSVRNNMNRILDFIFVDQLSCVSVVSSSFPLVKIDSYHPALEMSLNIKMVAPLKSNTVVSVYQFLQADYVELDSFFIEVDWSVLLAEKDINNMIQAFYDKLFEGIDLFVPRKIVRDDKFPKWFDKPLRQLIGQKNKLYHKFKRSGIEEDYQAYSNIRREVKYRTDMCYLLYVTQTELLIPENVKHFWSFVNNLRKDSGLPSIMKFKDLELNNCDHIANAFAEHFQSCYSDHDNIDLGCSSGVDFSNLLSFHCFTEDEILVKMQNLNTSKKGGPDGIHPILLKNCRLSLARPLCMLFQRSFVTGIFPDIWKYSILVPIFKSGDRADVENYRGISLLSSVAKLFESIITDELFKTYKHYIVPEQHGFYRGRSTATNLADYHTFLVSSVEAGNQVDVIYTDLSKAFDSVCHSQLEKKLYAIGVSGTYLQWITSYLTSRKQRVTVGGAVSREVTVTSGVPQGSHMGPVLFILFINDVVRCFQNSRCLLYADDLKIFSVVSPTENHLQVDLDNFASWCSINNLKLNVNKCKVMRFFKSIKSQNNAYFIEGAALETVSHINDLGVIFDSDLSFIKHIDNIISKAFRLLGFIKRNTKYIYDTKALLSLHNCLVRSILEYCSVIWSPYYQCHIGRLERVQNKFAKYLLFKFHFPYQVLSYETRLLLCGLQTLEHRRRKALLIFLYKLLKGEIDCVSLLHAVPFHVPGRRTRHFQLFFERTHRTNYGRSAFIDRLVNNYNVNFSDCDIFNLGLSTLKNL